MPSISIEFQTQVFCPHKRETNFVSCRWINSDKLLFDAIYKYIASEKGMEYVAILRRFGPHSTGTNCIFSMVDNGPLDTEIMNYE